jgi:hypothetical protein
MKTNDQREAFIDNRMAKAWDEFAHAAERYQKLKSEKAKRRAEEALSTFEGIYMVQMNRIQSWELH